MESFLLSDVDAPDCFESDALSSDEVERVGLAVGFFTGDEACCLAKDAVAPSFNPSGLHEMATALSAIAHNETVHSSQLPLKMNRTAVTLPQKPCPLSANHLVFLSFLKLSWFFYCP